ncbi:LysM peptidoglycan-binding domain-containing protein [Metabacillus sp. 84]|uniref:LysM peptidoglycan-binding domain-containing protein n=1 Tax=Metabacillus sp. 84 TaxID=3404705 RepID=UPI003CF6699F
MKKSLFTGVALAGFLSVYAAHDAEAASQTYKIKSGDSLSKIANVYNVSVSQLKEWNKLKSDLIYVGKSLTVSSPASSSKSVSPSSAPSSSDKYTVRSGDNLSKIASKYKVSVTQLKQWNNLKSDTIYAGKSLYIKSPSSGKTVSSSSKPASNNSAASTAVKHTVKSGDSLSKIANIYKVSINDIKQWNKLKSNTIYIGTSLYVKNPGSGSSKTGTSTTKPATATKPASSTTVKHTVKSGDSLSKIAGIYKVSVNEIKQWNSLKSNIIYIGDSLVVKKPSSGSNSNSGTTTPKPAPASYKYTVKSGDSLYVIGKRYGVSSNQIMEENKLKTTTIYVGQTLTIPSGGTIVQTSKPSAPVKTAVTYTVQPGNTLSAIASKYKTSVQEIKRINNLKSDTLRIGQILKMTEGELPAPAVLADGIFPLKPGTYQPYPDSWGNSRAYGGTRTHEGTDIMAKKGTPLYSITDGVVERYGWNELGGWRLTIRNHEGYRIYYAHMDKYASGLKVGQTVKRGQYIGTVGDSGYGKTGTTGMFAPHLHLGVYDKNYNAVNPYPFLVYWEQK